MEHGGTGGRTDSRRTFAEFATLDGWRPNSKTPNSARQECTSAYTRIPVHCKPAYMLQYCHCKPAYDIVSYCKPAYNRMCPCASAECACASRAARDRSSSAPPNRRDRSGFPAVSQPRARRRALPRADLSSTHCWRAAWRWAPSPGAALPHQGLGVTAHALQI